MTLLLLLVYFLSAVVVEVVDNCIGANSKFNFDCGTMNLSLIWSLFFDIIETFLLDKVDDGVDDFSDDGVDDFSDDGEYVILSLILGKGEIVLFEDGVALTEDFNRYSELRIGVRDTSEFGASKDGISFE